MALVRSSALVFLVLIGFAIGCSSKSADDPDSALYSEGETQDSSQADQARFGEGNIPVAEGEGLFRDVFFDFNSSSLSDAARQDIESNIETLKRVASERGGERNLRLRLEGHCDERGTAEYNLALGEDRARAVMRILDQYGVVLGSITTISYGEEIPLDPNHDEQAWAKNRRVHFVLY